MALFILISEPTSAEARRAFDALDDAFGTETFDKKSAEGVLKENGFDSGMFNSLVSGENVSEV